MMYLIRKNAKMVVAVAIIVVALIGNVIMLGRVNQLSKENKEALDRYETLLEVTDRNATNRRAEVITLNEEIAELKKQLDEREDKELDNLELKSENELLEKQLMAVGNFASCAYDYAVRLNNGINMMYASDDEVLTLTVDQVLAYVEFSGELTGAIGDYAGELENLLEH